MSISRTRPASPAAIWMALSAVYVVWGSTYLAIRVIVEADVPPLLSMGTRFLAAAALLAAWFAIRGGLGRLRITRRELVATGTVGLLLLLGGNGLVAVAEQTVPSGLAALLVATTPLWLVLLRLAQREQPRLTTWVGVLVGFAGVALLGVRGGGIADVESWGVTLIVIATVCWALGSSFSGRLGLPRDPMVATTWEMLLGGIALVVSGLAAGEGPQLHLGEVPAEAWWAWGYLVTIGSIVGYGAYVWLLANARISLVSTYAYVNPVVAVLLGWAILSEPVTGIVVAGGALVVAGVALVVSAERPRRAQGVPPAPVREPGPEPAVAAR